MFSINTLSQSSSSNGPYLLYSVFSLPFHPSCSSTFVLYPLYCSALICSVSAIRYFSVSLHFLLLNSLLLIKLSLMEDVLVSLCCKFIIGYLPLFVNAFFAIFINFFKILFLCIFFPNISIYVYILHNLYFIARNYPSIPIACPQQADSASRLAYPVCRHIPFAGMDILFPGRCETTLTLIPTKSMKYALPY